MNIKYILTNIHISSYYFVFCIVQILLSSLLIFYISLDFKKNHHKLFIIIIDFLLAFCMIFDSITSIYIKKNNEKIWNIIDLLLVIFYIILSFLLISNNNFYEDIFGFTILIIRFIIQIIRTLIFLKKANTKMRYFKNNNEFEIENLNMKRTSKNDEEEFNDKKKIEEIV